MPQPPSMAVDLGLEWQEDKRVDSSEESSLESEDENEALIFQYLCKSRVNKDRLRNVIIPHIMSMGFSSVDDLQDLEMKYLENNDITPLDRDRIMKVVSSAKSLEAFTNHVTKKSSLQDDDAIFVRYILCNKDLFSDDINESIIDDIKHTTLLKDIVTFIYDNSNLAANEMIELYSSEGYPLHSNELTNEESLKRWGVNDGDLFYVLIRKKDQPGQLQFATLPKVDYDIGQESFIIETPFMKDFTVNAYIDSDSPEDIAQKIYSITNIPVPYMSLYVRKSCHFEKLNTFTELNDDDIIRVVLRNPQEVATPRSPHYGSRSYNPLVPQTNEGMSKFFSILKFLCSVQTYNKEYKFEKLLCYILKITKFPPLVHALHTLREQSFLTIAGWTALIEGCYCLFKTILSDQIHVSDDKVFEFSDYTWGFLMHLSKEINEVDCVEFNQMSLVCPLSEKRIQAPVNVANNSDLGPFDKTNILSAPQRLSNYGIHFEVTDDVLTEDTDTARYLMYCPWESDDKVFVWETPPEPDIPMVCKKVCVQYSLDMITESLSELCIVHPHGLFAGNECLTYINGGRLVYFLGAAKGTDEKRRLYNPVSSNEEYILSLSKAELMNIGHQQLKEFVSHDLTTNLKASCGIYNPQELTTTRLSAIIEPQKSIQWEPEEAIVVLLDHSGSMSSAVYSELPKLRRIDAAKELFNAFATRTQAYKLHHEFGLTIFDDYAKIRLALTKNVENFEGSLRGVEPSGGTSIPTAIISAVAQLSRYTCMKRILCLTDGADNSSYNDAFRHVTAHNVTVDTVLLMNAHVGNMLKVISHASGGVCVCPGSIQEALTFFELDTVLSLRQREMVHSYAGQSLSRCTYTPFETKDCFKSKHQLTYKRLTTITVKSYIDRDRTALQLNTSSKQRRILKEMRDFLHSPHNDIRIYPCDTDCNKWKALMRGPQETCYENGAFVLGIEFLEGYPSVPPEVRFLTPIYHCNISSSSGRICHSILGEAYTPATSVKDILCHIYGLLMSPDLDSPLDSTLADEFGYLRHREEDLDKDIDWYEYFHEADEYFRKAQSHVRTHAMKSFDALHLELSAAY